MRTCDPDSAEAMGKPDSARVVAEGEMGPFLHPATILPSVPTTANTINACPERQQVLGLPKRSWLVRTLGSVTKRHDRTPWTAGDSRTRLTGKGRLFSERVWAWLLLPGKPLPQGKGSCDLTHKQHVCASEEPKKGLIVRLKTANSSRQAPTTTASSDQNVKYITGKSDGGSTSMAAPAAKRGRKPKVTFLEGPCGDRIADACAQARKPCQTTGCPNTVWDNCKPLQWGRLDDRQRHALRVGALVSLCEDCQHTASIGSKGVHMNGLCDCLSLQVIADNDKVLCLVCLRVEADYIAGATEQHENLYGDGTVSLHGHSRTRLRCTCRKRILGTEDEIRVCCRCWEFVRRPWARLNGVRHEVGLEPFHEER
ncbi:hypothetical protein M8818_000009 [Zalaria obscura]|uniref:Uncharacterized protein n=1 Tax=Zalaria obscura TaxID=2024903 RepID=A0ACC3SP02_9PEZI